MVPIYPAEMRLDHNGLGCFKDGFPEPVESLHQLGVTHSKAWIPHCPILVGFCWWKPTLSFWSESQVLQPLTRTNQHQSISINNQSTITRIYTLSILISPSIPIIFQPCHLHETLLPYAPYMEHMAISSLFESCPSILWYMINTPL